MTVIEFLGDSLDVLRAFPPSARQRAGYQLDRVERGLEPNDWKPMPAIGRGVKEVRVQAEAGAFRVIYFVLGQDAVYVLHCFQKKSRRTSRPDIELATRRYKDLLKALR